MTHRISGRESSRNSLLLFSSPISPESKVCNCTLFHWMDIPEESILANKNNSNSLKITLIIIIL